MPEASSRSGRDVVHAPDQQARVAGRAFDDGQRRAQAAREDVRLDPVRAAELRVVRGVREGDDLEAQPPPGRSARSQASKNAARYSAPTASSISIETIASYVPSMSR